MKLMDNFISPKFPPYLDGAINGSNKKISIKNASSEVRSARWSTFVLCRQQTLAYVI